MSNIVGELSAIQLEKHGITQQQVNVIRNKIVEVIRTGNEVAKLVSVAMRVFAGERVAPGKKLPGLVTHVFENSSAAEQLSHGLGRQPIGYLVLRRYPLGQVADAALEDWNPLTAFLQSDTAGLRVTVLFF